MSLDLDDLFEEAKSLPDGEREAFLKGIQAHDAELSARLEKLLTNDGSTAAGVRSEVIGSGSSHAPMAEVVDRLAKTTPSESRYELRGEVARGGMGAIIKVWDKALKRTLAMKVALGKEDPDRPGSTPAVDDKTLGRFLDEAQVTGQLDHPGIVPVHELGVADDGQVYFTMRLVKGETLGDIFEKAKTGEDGWTQPRVLGVILKACEAMAYAHSKGVIHRDLKPSNIMVGRFGEVYVMDWGLARMLGQEDRKDIRIQGPGATTRSLRTDARDAPSDSPLLTMDGDVVGTPAYMPPEQARGELDAMGPHSDVYALGAILYQLLAGHMPYVPPGKRVNQLAIWSHVQDGPPTPLSREASSAELAAICEKAMGRETRSRYADTSELAADLAAYIEGRVVRAYETGVWAETRKWVRRNAGLATATLIAFLSLASGLAVSLLLKGESDLNAQRAEQAAADARSARRVAEHSAYAARLSAALDADEAGLAASAVRQLEACPERLRGWEWSHLHLSMSHSEATLQHAASVRDVQFVGSDLLITQAGNSVIGWDTRSAEPVWRWDSASEGRAYGVLSTGGEFIAAIEADIATSRSDMTLLETSSGKERWKFSSNYVGHPLFTPGTSWIVLVPSQDSRSVVLDLSGTPVGELEFRDRPMSFVWADSGARWLGEVSILRSEIRLWRLVQTRPPSGSPDMTIDLSSWDWERSTPDWFELDSTDSFLAVAGRNGAVRYWDIRTNPPVQQPSERTPSAAWSPAGRVAETVAADRSNRGLVGEPASVMTAVEDGPTVLLELGDGSTVRLRGHAEKVNDVSVHQDRTLVASGSSDHTARLWRAASPKRVHRFEDAWLGSSGGRWVAISDAQARWLDTAGKELTSYPLPLESSDFALMPLGAGLALREASRFVVRDALGGELAATELDDPLERYRLSAVSPNGRLILLYHRHLQGPLVAWRQDSGEVVLVEESEAVIEEGEIVLGAHSARFSPCGERFAARVDETIRVWDSKTLSTVTDFPASRHFRFAGSDRIVGLDEIYSVDGPPVDLHAPYSEFLVVTGDGRVVIGGCPDGRVFACETESGRILREYRGHGAGKVACGSISPDMTRVAVGDSDGRVHLWDVETAAHLLSFSALHGGVRSVEFSDVGDELIARGNGEAVVFHTSRAQSQALEELWAASELARDK